MDLEAEISPELYSAVSDHYEAGLYSDAVTDAIQYITDLLREKADLDGDGAKLVGEALGGDAPAIRLNPMRTKSERNEQKGFQHLLRGVYIGLRNPRTHESESMDERTEAQKIICFLDWTALKIESAEEFFDIESFKERAFDPWLRRKYAEALANQVPKADLADVFREVFTERDKGDAEKLQDLLRAIIQRMDESQQKHIVRMVSQELRTVTSNSEIIDTIRHVKPDLWELLDEDVKHRIEGKFIESVSVGQYDVFRTSLKGGALGTWAQSRGEYFENKNDLARALIGRLKAGWYGQNYVAKYFLYSLPAIIEAPWHIYECCKLLCRAALSNDAKVVRSKLPDAIKYYPDEWKEKLKEYALQYRSEDEAYYRRLMSEQEGDDDLPF